VPINRPARRRSPPVVASVDLVSVLDSSERVFSVEDSGLGRQARQGFLRRRRGAGAARVAAPCHHTVTGASELGAVIGS
jgi:hypothetical protein